MESNVSLEENTLFGALTRPAMMGGVTLEYYLINIMFSVISFIVLNNLLFLAIFLPLHLFGVLVCRYDSHFFTLCYKKLVLLPQMKNQAIWGVRAYEPY